MLGAIVVKPTKNGQFISCCPWCLNKCNKFVCTVWLLKMDRRIYLYKVGEAWSALVFWCSSPEPGERRGRHVELMGIGRPPLSPPATEQRWGCWTVKTEKLRSACETEKLRSAYKHSLKIMAIIVKFSRWRGYSSAFPWRLCISRWLLGDFETACTIIIFSL